MKGDLRQGTVTSGIAVILPTFPFLSLFLGACYLLTPSSAFALAPTYHVLQQILPMHVWGAIFLILGTAQTICYLLGARRAMIRMLCTGSAVYLTWAVMFFIADLLGPGALPMGVGIYLFIALTELAAATSLSVDRLIFVGRSD